MTTPNQTIEYQAQHATAEADRVPLREKIGLPRTHPNRRRHAGLFSALVSWCDKAGNSLGSFLTGFILLWIAFDAKRGGPDLPIHPQSDFTLSWMKICYVTAPMIGAIATIILINRYRVTQQQMYEIKTELARRRS